MLIRGQTTEDRIGEIANKFSQGLQGYAQAKQGEAASLLQAEALRRQQALSAFEIENKLAETTGRFQIPGTGANILNGTPMNLGEVLSQPMTPKFEKDQAKALRDDQVALSTINKNNRTANTPPKLSEEEKINLRITKQAEAKAKERENPVYKLEKLGTEGRSKVASIASGFQALDQMVKSSDDGFGPQYVDSNTPLLGMGVSDNPYSEGERLTAEVIGRLQSGGAMNEAEVKTFRSLGPRPGDDKESRKRKLGQQKDFLKNKLTGFGMNDDDMRSLGFTTTSKYAPENIKMENIKATPLSDKIKFLRENP